MKKLIAKTMAAACVAVLLTSFTVNVYAAGAQNPAFASGTIDAREKVVSRAAIYRNIDLSLNNPGKVDAITDADSFVRRLYAEVLGRSASSEEISFYANQLRQGESATSVVRAFVYSDEFARRDTSDEQYVKILYRAVLGRNGSTEEVDYYIGLLGGGRASVLDCFVTSEEFARVCDACGIQIGGAKAQNSTDNGSAFTAQPSGSLSDFVRRLYTIVLERTGSDGEVQAHAGALLNGSNTASQMAYDFFFSPEYLKKNVGGEQYIIHLYAALFDRIPTRAEIDYYLDKFTQGESRIYVLACFVGSDEYRGLCAAYGVNVGNVEALFNFDTPPASGGTANTGGTASSQPVKEFVQRLYKVVLNRTGADQEVNNHANYLANGGGSAAQMAYDFFVSAEFANRKLSDTNYIKTLYQALFGRTPSDKEVAYYQDYLNRGASRNYLFTCFVGSDEFASICSGYGLSVGTAQVADVVAPSAGGNTGSSGSNETPWDGESLTVRYNGRNVTDTVENILVQTVYAEVGGFRNVEVYKAQAVAAYTYIRYHNSRGNVPSLPLTTPPTSVSGTLLSAVRAVKGQSLTYNGKLAQTTYYAMSNGKTNSSADMWGTSLGYLVSVDSKYDVNATSYKVNKTYTLNEFYTIMDKIYGGRSTYNTSGDPSKWITTTKNAAGYVTSINVCGRTPKVEYFYQTMFGLRSSAFDVSYNAGNQTFTFTTYGYGHGVGMSQWGAYYYAVNEGWGYQKILAHYYPGTTLAQA